MITLSPQIYFFTKYIFLVLKSLKLPIKRYGDIMAKEKEEKEVSESAALLRNY